MRAASGAGMGYTCPLARGVQEQPSYIKDSTGVGKCSGSRAGKFSTSCTEEGTETSPLCLSQLTSNPEHSFASQITKIAIEI